MSHKDFSRGYIIGSNLNNRRKPPKKNSGMGCMFCIVLAFFIFAALTREG